MTSCLSGGMLGHVISRSDAQSQGKDEWFCFSSH
jgi:hypothetical protein